MATDEKEYPDKGDRSSKKDRMKKDGHDDTYDKKNDAANRFVSPRDRSHQNEDKTWDKMHEKCHRPVLFRKYVQGKYTDEGDKENSQSPRNPVKRYFHVIPPLYYSTPSEITIRRGYGIV